MRLDPVSQHLLHGAGRSGPIALVYHGVCRTARGSRWSIPLAALEVQLDLLQDLGWRTVRVSELPSAGSRTVAITFDDGYANNLDAVEALSRRGMTATWFIVSAHVGGAADWDASETPEARMLSARDVRVLAHSGFEVGSHTRTHARLPGRNARSVASELACSKAELERLTERAVTSFAYPYGEWDGASATAVAEAGYRVACTTDSGWALRDRDPLRVRRLTVFGDDDLGTFARKLAFADNDAGWGRVAGYVARRALGRAAARR
jgi:peptidoglycan/xylan/chitin deacetylase (PgdA/CDA1 family)